MRRALIAILFSTSCDDAERTLVIPSVGTEFALYGTAAEGRAIAASSARVERLAELDVLTPESIGGGNIDMAFVGLDPADFPLDLSPDELTFVSNTDVRARPLPAIHAPHVFEEPVPSEQPAILVPVDQASVPKEFLAEREQRLERMLSGFAIENPCRPPAAEFSVFTPRIPAELIFTLRTMSNGDVIVGFSATSTAIIGVLGPNDEDPEIIGVTTSSSTPILPGEIAIVADLGDTEITGPGGRLLPGELTLNVEGGFGSVGGVAFWDAARGRWIDDTPPLADAFPRSLSGVRHVMFQGQPSICVFGSLQGADRSAAVWCRPAGGGDWALYGRFPKHLGVSALEDHDGSLYAFDLSGTVQEHAGGDDWNPIFSSSLNVDCDPLCAAFPAFARGTGGLFGVMAGGKAQVLLLESGGGSIAALEAEVVREALFADERADAEVPKRFTAVAVAPDGAVWLGTVTPDLFRISPDRAHVDRICLPEEFSGTQIAAIEPHPSGRLILGLAPAIFAFSDWRL